MGCSNCCSYPLTASVLQGNDNDAKNPPPIQNIPPDCISDSPSFIIEKKDQVYNGPDVKGSDHREMLKKKSKERYYSNNEQLPGNLKGLCDVNEQRNRSAMNQQMQREEQNRKENIQSQNMYESFEKHVEGDNLETKDGHKGYYNKDEREQKLNNYDKREKNEKVGNTEYSEKVEIFQKREEKHTNEIYSITRNNEYDNNFIFDNCNDKFKEFNSAKNNNGNNNVTRKVVIKKFGNGDDFEKEQEKARQDFEKNRREFANNFYNNSNDIIYQDKKSSYKVQEEQMNIIKSKKDIN